MLWKLLALSFADDRTVTPAEEQYRESEKAERVLERSRTPGRKPTRDTPPPWTSEPPHIKPEESVHDALVEGLGGAPDTFR